MSDILLGMVSYMNPQVTLKAVDSILEQYCDVDLHVWDNFSTVENRRVLKKNMPKDVNLHLSEDNLLWSPAVNRLINDNVQDHHKFIGFMNNDMTLPRHGIKTMISLLEENPEIGLVAPHGSGIGGQQDFISLFGNEENKIEYSRTQLKPERVAYIMGAFMLMRKETWQEVGSLDENMPLRADDHDYCIRVKAAGKQIWIDRRVYVWHQSHATGSADSWNEWGAKSWEYFNHKWAGYYRTEEEAIKSHWGGKYVEGWDK